MSERVQLKEQKSIILDESDAKQVHTMMELLEEDNCFVMDHSPKGRLLRCDGMMGVISLQDGKMIDIIPDVKTSKSEQDSMRLLAEMFYSVFGISTEGGIVENLFEFFVKLFIDSVSKLVARGLRSKYHLVRGNEKSFKGKIVFNEHIRQNYIHKERIFVEYEYYSQNRPENRLIKTTLEALSRKSTDSGNLRGLKNLVMTMEEIPSSVDVNKDFAMVVIDRNTIDYISPMLFCNIFLKGMGMAGASKDNISYAMLLDTDSLYSAYVAKMSTIERTEGSYQMRFDAEVKNEGGSRGVSVIKVDLDWIFYDRKKDETMRDAESLFLNAPGYRVIPDVGTSRLRSMAESYLMDVLV